MATNDKRNTKSPPCFPPASQGGSRRCHRQIAPFLFALLALFLAAPTPARATDLPATTAAQASPAPQEPKARFPRPDFRETHHAYPDNSHPPARGRGLVLLDLAVFAVALCLAAMFALRMRSRRALLALALCSVLYFGFFRKGCVCAVGSLQNAALALFQPEAAIPLAVLAFFLLPLACALLFGRVFCAGVCPLGAAQELLLIRPVRVPAWLDRPLRILPWFHLSFAVLMAATGAAFVICEYDPVVALFRLSGTRGMLLVSAMALILSLGVGRPYCRYLCPYGALLGLCSRLSWRHTTITPDTCVHCRLCENACPYGSIRTPEIQRLGPALPAEKRLLAWQIMLLPLLVAMGALAGLAMKDTLSRMHVAVRTAEAVALVDAGATPGPEQRDLVDGFALTRQPQESIRARAAEVRRQMGVGAALAGGFLGLVLSLSLLGLSLHRRRGDYEPDRASCVSCGRCLEYCPQEHLRRGKARG